MVKSNQDMWYNWYLEKLNNWDNIIPTRPVYLSRRQRNTFLFLYLAIDRSKRWRNCLSAVWYMMLTIPISTIKKYKILPRAATGRNSSRAVVILISVSAAVCNFWLTSWAVDLVMFKTLIKFSSSTREPWENKEGNITTISKKNSS